MLAHYNLKKMPFDKRIKTEKMFHFFDHKEALARLSFIKQYRGIVSVTGEAGSGKTSVLRSFVSDLNPQIYAHCYSAHSTLSKSDFYRHINSMLKLNTSFFKSKMFDQIQKNILNMYDNKGKIPCIILDECHLMHMDVLQELVLLTNFEMDSKTPLILILSGTLYLNDKLNRRFLEELNQRIDIKITMNGLQNPKETKDYILHNLNLSGSKEPIFEENVYSVIYKLTNGLPRKTNNICKAAMMYAFSQNKKIIDTSIIQKAAGNL